MSRHLFLALHDEKNPRGHPIMAALLYAYCPIAARWWMSGADPVLPVDPRWMAMLDWTTGKTLGALLKEKYKMDDDLRSSVREFIQRIDTLRHQFPDAIAPEAGSLFPKLTLKDDNDFGNAEKLQAFGGRWENFMLYVHTWAFLIQDWRHYTRIGNDATLHYVRMVLRADGIRKPLYFPMWLWAYTKRPVTRSVVTLLVDGDAHYPPSLMATLLMSATVAGDEYGRLTPELWICSMANGAAHSYLERTPEDVGVGQIILAIAEVAKNGPYPPTVPLHTPKQCVSCAYQRLCWLSMDERGAFTNETRMTPLLSTIR